jgi:hypothetical protein
MYFKGESGGVPNQHSRYSSRMEFYLADIKFMEFYLADASMTVAPVQAVLGTFSCYSIDTAHPKGSRYDGYAKVSRGLSSVRAVLVRE